jgi:prepilin-type N-terminal cleavage/methylation domain-containing protein
MPLNAVFHAWRAGFTLIELLVVIAIIAVLAALLLPVLSHAKQRAQGVLCLNAGKQIMVALTLYGSDNNDFFPPNPDDGNSIPGYNWCSGDVRIGATDVLKDPKLNLVISYLSGNTSLFHCPGDKRMGLYSGSDPTLQGQAVMAARTFSMNQAVGTIDPTYDRIGYGGPHGGVPNLSVNAPWLDNHYGNRRNSPWRTYGKFSSLSAPGPSSTWVLLDEDPAQINDAAFGFAMEKPEWIDIPGTYHNSGCGLAFADAHSEAHRWRMVGRKSGPRFYITDAADKQDWLWLRERTSADATGTMPAPTM